MASSKFPEKYSTDISRRQVLKSISQAAVGVTAITQAPYVFAEQRTQLRVLGTHVTLQEELRQKAMQDLDIDLIFEPRGSAAVLQKASTNPQSFDLYEQWSNSIRPLWTSGSIQPIDKKSLPSFLLAHNMHRGARYTGPRSRFQQKTSYNFSAVFPSYSKHIII